MNKAPWMQSYSGKRVDLLDPKPEQIDHRDIAHHLSIEPRFTGATYRPYSVAQHCVNVARYAGGWDGANYTRLPEARFGLLHDASEAYLKDINGPLKKTPIFDEYVKLEEKFTVLILVKYGLVGELTEEVEEAVKRADQVMLMTEKRDLLVKSPEPWQSEIEPDYHNIEPWSWRTAEVEWLKAFGVLFPTHK